MMSKRKDFSYLLEKFRNVYENYHVDRHGVIVDKNHEILMNQNTLSCVYFCNLYCEAYREFAKLVDYTRNNKMVDDSNYKGKEFVNRVLSDDKVFNSFMNNLIIEYKMYDQVGTGKISYTPFSVISDYIFENYERTYIIYAFLKNELKNVIEEDHLLYVKTEKEL